VLPALREDPHQPARPVEQPRRVLDGRGPVGRLVEVHAEGAHQREEGQAPQVPGVHEGVAVGAQQVLRGVQHHQRIPPRGVVGDDQDRPGRRALPRGREPVHAHAAEGALDAPARVGGEPGVEVALLGGGDHRGGW
jgi:hypothetical protein